jgi:hypothetical protein
LLYVVEMDLLDKHHASQSHKYAVDLLLNGIMREKARGPTPRCMAAPITPAAVSNAPTPRYRSRGAASCCHWRS